MVGAEHEIDLVAGGVLEVDEAAHVALFAFVRGTEANLDTGVAEFRSGRVQFIGGAQLEAHRVVRRVAVEVHQGVVATVAAEVRGARLLPCALQAEHLTRKEVRLVTLPGSEAHVANIEQVDHGMSPFCWGCRHCRKIDDIPEMKK